MSTPIRRPLFMAGTPRSSGDIQTGEVNMTRGGNRTYTATSGVAVDTLIYAGAGRLNTAFAYTRISGHVIFYDAGTAVSGGPFAGNKVLGYIGDNMVGISGVAQRLLATPIAFDMPFQSGLVAAPVGSGGPSFTLSFIPESSILDGGTIAGS